MFRILQIAQFWLCSVATTFLSVVPPGGSVDLLISDKLVHLIGYCLLFVSCEIAYPKRNIWAKLLFVLSFSILIEIIQYFLPYREFSLLDIVANLVGVGLGGLLLVTYKRIRPLFFCCK